MSDAPAPFVVGKEYKIKKSSLRRGKAGHILGAFREIVTMKGFNGKMVTYPAFANDTGLNIPLSDIIPVDQVDYANVKCKKRYELVCEDGSAGCFLDLDEMGQWPPIAKGGNRRKSRQKKRRSNKRSSTRHRRS
jgi:hypothetical protein